MTVKLKNLACNSKYEDKLKRRWERIIAEMLGVGEGRGEFVSFYLIALFEYVDFGVFFSFFGGNF